ncbi:single-stranded DNA-binding protein [Oscillibacter sp. MSJ-2]|uniref:Single-stranded DNA-binding protein n=1 Tax=Dysosmobacter acutus TaxID=2841504 RepID=A0ABS6F887_9FIRM|nr:single-stranded DNA-binding protein [Dysosmobacter acutus]MBU5626504.1 single-stranded DNA-binding protein [Dysosmobacter acutus]
MYIKGITEYAKDGSPVETALVAGKAVSDGERRTTKSGKAYGTVSVKAFGRKDGTAAFLTVKAWDGPGASAVASLRKGDAFLVAGRIDRREYNGKSYTDLAADFVWTGPAAPSPAAALTERMESAGEGFVVLDGDESELPF